MAKEITLVINVDLDCERCDKKIREVLDKIRNKKKIEYTFFYKEKDEVTISGRFDANEVRRKLCCEAGQIIKGIKVKKEERPRPVVPEFDFDVRAVRPLVEKVFQGPKARPEPGPCRCSCPCTCAKQTTQPPELGMAVAAPASSVSGHGHEAPSYYGVPVYSIAEGWY